MSDTSAVRRSRRPIWPMIRKAWITSGILFTIVFVGWMLLAVRGSEQAYAALQSDGRVQVTEAGTHWSFTPRARGSTIGLVFFPGAPVDPVAYAPLVRAAAEAGHPAVLVRVPRRGVFGGADGAEVLVRATAAMSDLPDVDRWVVAGHSKGGLVAARFARTRAPSLAGLVLIGTSHPRDFSLADTPLHVTRISGTRDTVADVEKLAQNRPNLPAEIADVRIDGGNHSQFGYYGFQPGDWPATISREEQQRITVAALLEALRAAEHR